ncbi:MAG: hypothetical protein ACQKBV_10470 [Puniceicoccales bacterium]
MPDSHLITANLAKNLIVLTICDQIENVRVRRIREEIIPLVRLFDEPVTLLVDMREAQGDHLDALEELTALYREFEGTAIRRIVRVHANDNDDHGTGISDIFHLRHVAKKRVLKMKDALRYCEDESEYAEEPRASSA